MLTFYERDKTSTYIALSFAALFLEIYGALLASINIMVSISLQASQASSDARTGSHGTNGQRAEADLRISQGFKWQWMGPPTTSSACSVAPAAMPSDTRSALGQSSSVMDGRDRRATTIALCVLDRLTVSCGFIIPIGGMLQLTGLTMYAIQTHPGPAVYSLIGAILFAFSMTLLGLGQGLYTGNRLFRNAQAAGPPNSGIGGKAMPVPEDDRKSFTSSHSSHSGIRRPDYDLDDDDDNICDQHGSTQRLMGTAILNSIVIA